jgi:hypothetical protein
MLRTGLEPILAEYQVKVGNDRLVSIQGPSRNPQMVRVVPDPNSTNPIAKAFVQSGVLNAFLFDTARTVAPASAAPGAPNVPKLETVLVTWPDDLAWAETNLDADPRALIEELRKDRQKLVEKLTRIQALSVAVAVSEGGSPPVPIPGHENLGTEGQPRMVVFGSSSWLTNQMTGSRFGQLNPDLFASTLSWLREKPNLGAGAQGKERNQWRLNVPSDGGWRLLLLPVALVLLAVCLLGSGVWIVRRR